MNTIHLSIAEKAHTRDPEIQSPARLTLGIRVCIFANVEDQYRLSTGETLRQCWADSFARSVPTPELL